MAISNLVFDPENGFEDTSSYPDPNNEAEAREQLMSLHSQTRDYINTNIKPYVELIESIAGEDIQRIIDAINGTQKSYTLAVDGWVDNTYTISDELITADSKQELLVSGLTDTEYNAIADAILTDGGQTAGSLTLVARGTVPTIAIPIIIAYHG